MKIIRYQDAQDRIGYAPDNGSGAPSVIRGDTFDRFLPAIQEQLHSLLNRPVLHLARWLRAMLPDAPANGA